MELKIAGGSSLAGYPCLASKYSRLAYMACLRLRRGYAKEGWEITASQNEAGGAVKLALVNTSGLAQVP